MTRGQKRSTPVVPSASRASDQMKYEVAQEYGIQTFADDYWVIML